MTSAYEPDFPSLLKALRAAGVTGQVIGSDGIDSPTTFSLGDVAEGVVFTTAGHATPGSPLEAFNSAYEAANGAPPETIFSAVGYDLIKVLEAAVLAADGSVEPSALRDADCRAGECSRGDQPHHLQRHGWNAGSPGLADPRCGRRA